MNHNFGKHILTVFALLSGLILILSARDGTTAIHAAGTIPVACTNGVGDVGALFDAINEANLYPGTDTIVLGQDCEYIISTPATTDTGLPLIQDHLIIEGNRSVIKRPSTAQTEFRLLYVYASISLTMNDLTLTGGRKPGFNGGAVYGDPLVDLVFNHVNFEYNVGMYGGAIYTQGRTTINHSTFLGNSAQNKGGAIYSTRELTITQTDLKDHIGREGGGAIYAMGEVTIHDSRFMANRTNGAYDGGAILSTDKLTLRGSHFAYNQARDGGAVHGNDVLIDSSVFRENYASHNGGGLFAADARRGISGTLFQHNRSSYGGGGLYVLYKLDLRRNYFTHNQAVLLGGGLNFRGDSVSSTVIENNLWVNNASNTAGGQNAITLGEQGGSTVHVRHNTFVSSYSGWPGPAIRIDAGEAILENNIITGFQTAIKDFSGIAVSRSNLYFNNGINEDGLVTPGENILQVDPLFVGDDNYRLSEGSAAIDSATDTGESGTLEDILGTPRPRDDHPDRGAYEFTGNDERVFAVTCADGPAGLSAAIIAANRHFGPDVVQIEDGGCLFELPAATGQFSYMGLAGLPAVMDTLRLDGRGATVQRPESEAAFRILENYARYLTVENLTIRNGYAQGSYGYGGGIYSADRTQLRLIGVNLYDNQAASGGGGVLSEGSLIVENSRVIGNLSYDGGGLTAYDYLILSNSVIADNEAVEYGGGVWAEWADITNTLFEDNRAGIAGGGASLDYTGGLQASTFIDNRAGPGGGSGLYVGWVEGITYLSNNVWLRNEAENGGAALKIGESAAGSTTNLWHNTFVGHQTPQTTAIELFSEYDNTSFLVANNIIVGHTVGVKNVNKGVLTTDANLYFDNVTKEVGADNSSHHVEADPKLVNPDGDDVRLREDSEAIDSAADRGVEVDRNGIARPQGDGFDIGAHEYMPNVAPTAAPDSYSTIRDSLLEIPTPGVLGNDVDVNGDALTAVLVDDVAGGTLTLRTNGSFTYTPNAGFIGSDSFTYRASDGRVQSAPVTVTINVLPVGGLSHQILLPVVVGR